MLFINGTYVFGKKYGCVLKAYFIHIIIEKLQNMHFVMRS